MPPNQVDASSYNARFRLIYDLANAFASRLEIDDLIPFVLAECREILSAGGVSILLFDAERDELYFPYVAEQDAEVGQRLMNLRFPASRGIAGAVLKTGRAEKVDDVRSDPRFYSEADRRSRMPTGSLLAAPLVASEKRLGVIEAVSRRGRPPFTDTDLALFESLAASIAVAVQNAGRFDEMKASEARLRTHVSALRVELARQDRFTEIVAVSPGMERVFRLMENAAASTINVLIEGETGTGKELVARAIHRTSNRGDGPFLAVNCAALQEGLLESELFGHRRGAFTGAINEHQGLFRAASGGVIFLDEISEMSLSMQAKLLRVLQEGELTPVGDTRPLKVDVRVVSATNRDLMAAVQNGTFREDLYYRLAAFPIRVPSLRERRDDIPLLAARFLEASVARHSKRIAGISQAALELLTRADWRGNVRQLQNEIERAVVLASNGATIGPALLSVGTTDGPGTAVAECTLPTLSKRRVRINSATAISGLEIASLRDARAAFEARYIVELLSKCEWNVSHTAKALGISRVALQKKIKQYGLRTG